MCLLSCRNEMFVSCKRFTFVVSQISKHFSIALSYCHTRNQLHKMTVVSACCHQPIIRPIIN